MQPQAAIICQEHRQLATFVCLNKTCNVKVLCDRCRLTHRHEHPTNADEHSIQKVLETCRTKISKELRMLQGTFFCFQSHLKVGQALKSNKQLLNEWMKQAMDRVKMLFSELNAKMDIENQELERILKNSTQVRETLELKRKLTSLARSPTSADQIRQALKFDCSEAYERLKMRDIRPIAKYRAYDSTYQPVVQLTLPQLKTQNLRMPEESMMLRNFSNDSNQYIHITPPIDPVYDCQSVFYFDVSHSQLKIYNIVEQMWKSVVAPQELSEYGQGLHDNKSNRYFYIGGSGKSGKSSRVLTYDANEKRWETTRSILRPRSSFGSCMIVSKSGPSKIMIVGGLGDRQPAQSYQSSQFNQQNQGAYQNYGGVQNASELLKECQIYDILDGRSTQIAPLNFAAASACLCYFSNRYVFKIGGMASTTKQEICRVLEKYDIETMKWTFINADIVFPTGVQQQPYSLFFTSQCAAQVNPSEIFIFGGYSSDNAGTTESFVMNVSEVGRVLKLTIRFWNMKPLPIAAGFSRTKPIIHNQMLYVLQDLEFSDRAVRSDQKNLLRFDGFQWALLQKTFI